MYDEGVADNDPQMQQARDQLFPRFLARFHSAIRECFTTLHYPTRDRLSKVDFLMEFRENHYDGEQQVVAALSGKQKYTEDIASETFRKKVEARLFTQSSMLWSEVIRRAATTPGWQWHRSDALDRLKQECVHEDRWPRGRAIRQQGTLSEAGNHCPHPGAVAQRRHRQREAAGLAGQRRPGLLGSRRGGDSGLEGSRRRRDL